MIEVFTDGCCMKNPGGVGGWGWVAVENGRVIEQDSGGHPKTSNNKMEMQAVIEALKRFGGKEVEIVSDSKYVIEGILNWMPKWKKNGWRRKTGKKKMVPVANLKLWKEMDSLREGRKVEFSWIKGHKGHKFNEMADYLAGAAAAEIEPNVF